MNITLDRALYILIAISLIWLIWLGTIVHSRMQQTEASELRCEEKGGIPRVTDVSSGPPYVLCLRPEAIIDIEMN